MSLAPVATIPPQTHQVVDTRYTQDVIPVLDTSKFEHMQRIAVVMAKSSVIPESLRKGKDASGKECALSDEAVIANCFRIVNQAVRWGMDPFAVADCASIVYGRLMWEGKLVHAVIEAKLGTRLTYTFTDEDQPADSLKLGVIVSGTLPGETNPRTIEGTVAAWHKGSKSPWANPAYHKRQLRYMGAREWARAHSPGVILGIYTDDELDDIVNRDVPAGHRAMRMKDVTPAKPAVPVLEIPDDEPDSPDRDAKKSADISTQSGPDSQDNNPDQQLADPDSFLTKVSDDLALCESVDQVNEVEEQWADIIPRLPPEHQRKLTAMFTTAKGE